MTQTQILVLIGVCLLVAIAVGVVLSMRRHQTAKLRQRFGPEYGRTVERVGDRVKAESELRERERRVARLRIEPLAPAEAARFAISLRMRSSASASEAVGLSTKRLCTAFHAASKRAADISVDHPRVVENYRQAHSIAVRHQRGESNTEDLRRALIHYRALFDELLEVGAVHQPAHASPIAGAKP